MRRQRYGTNERTDQNSEKERSEMEIASLSDAEFKILVIGCLGISLSTANAYGKK